MAYGTIKVDNITYTNAGSDTTVTVSGLATGSGFSNLTVTGTISGATITGNVGEFTTLTAGVATINGQIGLSGANYGTSGQVLTSAGSGAAPTWTTPSAGNTDKIEEGNTSAEVIDTGSDGRFVVTTEGTERLRIGANGQIGLSGTNYGTSGQVLTSAGSGAAPTWTTPSAGNTDKIEEGNSSAEVIDTGSDGRFVVTTEGSERARVDSSGRLLVGTSTARANFQKTYGGSLFSAVHQIEGAVDTTTRVTSQVYGKSDASGPAFVLAKHRSDFIGGQAITAQGDVLGEISFHGSDGTKFIEAVNIKAIHDPESNYSGTDYLQGKLIVSNRDGAVLRERIQINWRGQTDLYTGSRWVTLLSGASINITPSPLLRGYYGSSGFGGGGTESLLIQNDGSIYNLNGIYSSFSDIKLKENIVDAGSQWDDLKALRVRKYNLKEGQTHTQIGLIAQEAELVSPGLVADIHDRDKDGNELDTVTKGVKYSVLYMKAIKALQEAMERIETLEAKVAALEGL